MKKVSYYSVLWYTEYDEEKDQPVGDFEEKEFPTRQSALRFYDRHKKDADKFAWWVSSRDEEGFVIKDYIY